MRERFSLLPSDLQLMVVFALASFLLALLPLRAGPLALLLLPLVLLLPGYALSAAIFPRWLPAEERLVYSVAFSICAVAIGGVVVQIVLPLDEAVSALLLALITIGASFVAGPRREAEAQPGGTGVALPSLGIVATLFLIVAMVLTGWSIAVATDGAHDQSGNAHFSALWILADPERPSGAVEVGVENQEGHTASYELVVSMGDASQELSFKLEDGEKRVLNLGESWRPIIDPTRVLLYRGGELDRRVQLNPETLE